MMLRLTKITCCVAMLAFATSANAAIIWTGAVDSDIKNDGNYDFSGSSLATIAGIEASGTALAGVADDIVYNNSGTAPELPNVAGQLNYGSLAFGLTFDNVISTTAGGNEGWRGATISLINGAQTTGFFFVGTASTVSIDATSSAILQGGGNPVNGVTIDMAPGAVVTFTAEDPLSANGWLSHIGKFTVNGAALVDGVNATVVSDGGNGTIVTAIVPEPGTLALAGLASISLLAVRRRRS